MELELGSIYGPFELGSLAEVVLSSCNDWLDRFDIGLDEICSLQLPSANILGPKNCREIERFVMKTLLHLIVK